MANEAVHTKQINTSQTWTEIVEQARGETVYFNAWGGSSQINQYIQWASIQLQQRYNIQLRHVKVSDISQTTSQLITEKITNKNTHGRVDLMWLNGKNFKSMKEHHLLTKPFVSQLPNWKYVDQTLPVTTDFSEPTEELEAPWGVGQLVFIYDKNKLYNPPKSFKELLSYAQAFPNRITYPRPPEFHGSSFLKALLIELTNNDPDLANPVTTESFERLTKPLWHYLDQLHKVAWRGGKQFPKGTAETLQLLDDGQIDLAITFNPNAVYAAQNNGQLAESTHAYAMINGALSNIHYLTIPWNANAPAAAKVVINFLLSPEAQSRKGDLNIWGDPSVLQTKYLTGDAKKIQHFPSIDEPNPSWQAALEKEWQQRYGH